MTLDEKIQRLEAAIELLEGMLRELRIKRTSERWMQQEQEMQQEFPGFSLSETARQSERFCVLLGRYGDVRRAYLEYKEGP